MKKAIKTILIGLIPFVGFAQGTKDSVNTAGGVNDHFYSFDNGSVATRTAADWHIAFEISGFSGSIRVNGPAGVKLFRAPYTVANFATVDTAGMSSWDELVNSTATWSSGAFNSDPADDYDLGWGVYNPANHIVEGDSVYLIQLPNKDYKKIYIHQLVGGKYIFKHADLDGKNEKTDQLAKADFGGKVFGYFNLTTGKIVDTEPNKDDWDILFTKYIDLVPTPYALSGVLINPAAEVAQRDGVDVSSNDTSSLTWTNNISTIGSDWKRYNFPMGVYEITADQAFFVRTGAGAVWKMYFTAFKGGTDGEFVFVKELIKGSAAISNTYLSNAVNVFPNPSNNGVFNIATEQLQNASYVLTNMNGQVIMKGQLEGQFSIDLSSETDGLYFLSIWDGQNSAQKVLMKH